MKFRADIESEKADKIISGSFYEHHKFGLVYNRGAFRFIDKSRNEVEKLGHWDWAIPFQLRKNETFDNFLAIVVDDVNYLGDLRKDFKLLDTLGGTLPLSFSLEYLNEKTKALIYVSENGKDFSNQIIGNTQLEILGLGNILNIPATIRNLRNLKILILLGDQIEHLPKEIGELVNLKHLDLELENLKSLNGIIGKLINLEKLELRDIGTANFNINELANLKKLKVLNLEGLNLDDDEENKIRKLLPNCEIEF